MNVYSILSVTFGGITLVLSVGAMLIRWGITMGRDEARLRAVEDITAEISRVHIRIGDVEDTLERHVLNRTYVTRYPEHQAARQARAPRPGREPKAE
jgi:hypothetical protein